MPVSYIVTCFVVQNAFRAKMNTLQKRISARFCPTTLFSQLHIYQISGSESVLRGSHGIRDQRGIREYISVMASVRFTFY